MKVVVRAVALLSAKAMRIVARYDQGLVGNRPRGKATFVPEVGRCCKEMKL